MKIIGKIILELYNRNNVEIEVHGNENARSGTTKQKIAVGWGND